MLDRNGIIERLRGELKETNDISCKRESSRTEQETENNVEIKNELGKNDDKGMIEDKDPKTNSQSSLAGDVIKDQGITLVPKMGGFMVRVRRGILYAVKLFPKEFCHCSSSESERCFHILAAKQY